MISTERRVVENRETNRFEVPVDDTIAGFITYWHTTWSAAFTPTIIEQGFKGWELSWLLVRDTLVAMRETGYWVLGAAGQERESRATEEHLDGSQCETSFRRSSSARPPLYLTKKM
jgi:hypothetical protein